jgi:hypothetical protein
MSEQNPYDNKPLPAAWVNNNFVPPKANVEDVRNYGGDGTLLDEPNQLSAGRGSAWWSDGWGLFRQATGVWIGIVVVYLVMITLSQRIPLIGPFASLLLGPIMIGGIMSGCRNLENGEELRFSCLFAGFNTNLTQLALTGLLYLTGFFVIIFGVILVGGGMGAAMSVGILAKGASPALMLALLLAAGLMIPLAMALWFAPALVMLNNLTAIDAMKLSFQGSLRNMMPFTIYGLIGMAFAIVATIPLMFGWLVLFPTMFCSTYVAYREIFLEQ